MAVLALGGLGAHATAADALLQSNALRLHGCVAHRPARTPLQERAALNETARRWADGATLSTALQDAGYRPRRTTALHVSGDERALVDALRTQCAAVTDAQLTEFGSFRRGNDLWVLLATPLILPAATAAASQVAEVLNLTNRARAQARQCGARSFAAAPPLTLEPRLNEVATAHASDMLARHYFDHRDPAGRTPADRVRARGYRYLIVGENIASGAIDAREAVQGWLESPGHCENIMDPRFTRLGVGFADTASGAARIDWVQVFAAPAR